MNAPVMPMTGTDLKPTSYICGKTSRMFFQRSDPRANHESVRPTNAQNSPNAARMANVVSPSLCAARVGIERGIIRPSLTSGKPRLSRHLTQILRLARLQLIHLAVG